MVTKQKLDVRAQRSYDAIVQAALVALNKNPDATLKDIAAAAQVGRATLYRLFDSKEALAKTITLTCFQRFDAATAHIEDQARSAQHAIELLFRSVLPMREEMQFIMTINELALDDPELIADIKRQRDETAALIEQAKQEGTISPALPNDWVVNVMEGITYSGWMAMQEQGYAEDDVVQLCMRSFFSGVGP